MTELQLRQSFNRWAISAIKIRGQVSLVAKRQLEAIIKNNELRISELRALEVFTKT